MSLAAFIRENLEPIVAEWETFARSLVPVDSMDIAELRDHATQMLVVIARDLETPQTETQGSKKSRGESDADQASPDTPAQAHGTGRAGSGFDVVAMVSEYRALRASVIRLWTAAQGELGRGDIDDLVRFSEAIDQALAESTDRFMAELDRTREIFLGILGHDLRTPLGAMITSAQFILEVDNPSTAHKMAQIIVSSGSRMNHMVGDLLEFTRGQLGTIPLDRAEIDLGDGLRASIQEIEASRPGRRVSLETEGDLRGDWDGPRLSQVWSNLLGNAVDHGLRAAPISVTARGNGREVVCSVHNYGPEIPAHRMRDIFKPLISGSSGLGSSDHLGLGLYIADRIVDRHGGRIEVESSQELGTTFSVHLPRGREQR